jgi:hypothetical protein
MRPLPALTLLACCALAGCTSATATYRIDGADQTLSLRANQDYFWSDVLTVGLVTARMPDCQRKIDLGKVRQAEFDVEVFDSGDDVYTLRAGEQMWQVNIQTCTNLGEPGAGVSGLPVGNFKFDEEKKLVFLKAGAPAAK